MANVLFAARLAVAKASIVVSQDEASAAAESNTPICQHKPESVKPALAGNQPSPNTHPARYRSIQSILREDMVGLNVPMRVGIVAIMMLLGFVFFPMFLIGTIICWSIIEEIRDAPATRAQEADTAARIYASSISPITVEYLREQCESPAETAFLDAMVSSYELKTGPGAATGRGLRLRSQIGIGAYSVKMRQAPFAYRADFLVDEKLVIEIDGAAFHSSPDAVARDKVRDENLRNEGYTVLRIAAKVVFNDPKEAVNRVELARAVLRMG